ncbi:MAG TPA: ATP-binding protein [Chroococcidiopsis sp.]
MTSLRPQDLSLYELALSSEHPPHPLQVSPTTFKSMVSVLLDTLIDQKISATLWIKMPKGDAWKAEIERFKKASPVLNSIYLFQSVNEGIAKASADDLLDAEGVIDRFDDVGLIDDQSYAIADSSDFSTVQYFTLAADSQLRREYFLLILSEELCGLVLAHRPRSVKRPKSEGSGAEGVSSKLGSGVDDDQERKHPLLGLCSFEPKTLKRVLAGVIQAGKAGLTVVDPAITTLLGEWDGLVDSLDSAPLNPIVMGSVFTYQVQQQEEVWHSSAAYRRQADMASVLRLENEELSTSVRSKDEFLKNIGQELRTPLATMKTALSLLNSPNLKPAQRQRYMDMLSQECDRQSALITSVLDLVQLESDTEQIPTQPLRLMDIVPGVVSTYQPLAQEKGVMLAYTIPDDLPAVSCPGPYLRQIVINLIHNGIKFTPQGGQVWVKAKSQGDLVQIEVRDTGIGIDANDIARIFDRFYRIRTSGGDEASGAGLGLSIVQQLLVHCGGSISVKSKPNEGSAFTVLLPVYRG